MTTTQPELDRTRHLRVTWDDVGRWVVLLRSLPISVIATDIEGVVQVWNDHAAELFGWRADEVLGRRIQELTVGPQDLSVAESIVARVANGGVWDGDFSAMRRDGTSIDIHVIDAPIFAAVDTGAGSGASADAAGAGEVVGIVGLSVDVTAGHEYIKNNIRLVREASLHSLVEVDVERRRIALAVHDEIGQVLTALRSEVQWLKQRPADEQHEIIDRITSLVDSGIDSVRRVCDDLRPRNLHELGLEESIRNMARDTARRIGADVDLEIDTLPLLSPPAAIAMFRTAQESLTNIERHAPGSALISVRFGISDGSVHLGEPVVVLQVACDAGSYSGSQGYGISGMRNRIVALGGSIVIESVPGGGTQVTAEIGCDIAIAPEPSPDGPPIEYRGHEWHIVNER